MKTLKSLGLSDSEIEFVEKVYLNPCCKIRKTKEYIDDGSEYGTFVALWKKPEKLGLIECVGNYKWKPTEKVKMVIVIDEP